MWEEAGVRADHTGEAADKGLTVTRLRSISGMLGLRSRSADRLGGRGRGG